jgi:hypothetical protein
MEKKKQENLIDSIINSLDGESEEIGSIFTDEEHEEQDEASDNNEADEAALAAPEKKAPLSPPVRRIFVTFAAFLLFFAVIGVIVSVTWTWERVSDIRDRRTLKEEIALFVYPVVINDPPAFETVDSLPAQTMITCAIWNIVLTGDKTNYDRELGMMFIPARDVELSARSLFGRIVEHHEHESVPYFGSFDFIRYDPDNGTYAIRESATMFTFSPLITSVTNVGELYTVTIDYMPPRPLAIAGIEHEMTPAKTMIYTISRGDGRMTINSIQFSE